MKRAGSRPSRPCIVVLGGGVSAIALFDALSAADLGPLEVRLHARRTPRAALIASRAAERVAVRSPELSITAVDQLDRAVEGADAVIALIRVGGWMAREYDELFPARYGLVGDEGLGLGGAANAWRTVPTVDEIAAALLRGAPEALVLNQVAPLGVTTRRFVDLGLSALGICELPILTGERLVAAGLDRLAYVGLNHAGWFVPADAGDETAADRLRDAGLAARLVDAATWSRFGGVPVPYHFRVLDPRSGAALGIEQPTGRARQLAALSDATIDALTTGAPLPEPARPTPWFDRALVPVLRACLGGAPYRGTVNVVNQGQVTGVRPEVVVEVEATIDASGTVVHPVPVVPDPIGKLVGALGVAEDLLTRASVERDSGLLRDAITALPDQLRPAAEHLDAAVSDVLAGEAVGR